MGFTFDRDGAMKAGESDFITESGVYIGKLTKAVETNHDTGAVSITFEFVSNEGQTAKYLRLITAKKDKTEAFGANHVYALMGLLKLQTANPVNIDGEHFGYPMFCNKPIGIILQRENKDDGKFGMNILHFIDAFTMKTASETFNNEEAKVHKKEIKDKTAKPQHKQNNSFNNDQPPSHTDDDLPF